VGVAAAFFCWLKQPVTPIIANTAAVVRMVALSFIKASLISALPAPLNAPRLLISAGAADSTGDEESNPIQLGLGHPSAMYALERRRVRHAIGGQEYPIVNLDIRMADCKADCGANDPVCMAVSRHNEI
jgi:hypothetical protein